MAKQKPKAGVVAPTTPRQTVATAAEAGFPIMQPEPDPHAEIRRILALFPVLKQAWQDETGAYHFDEKAALKAAGGNADLLTIILPDHG